MKFYSKITNRPNSVIEEVKDGLKVVSQKRLCTFFNGELETNDQRVIQKLLAKPNLFKTTPWNEPVKVGNKIKYELLKYAELLIEAKKAGIESKKKKEIIEALNKKEVK